MPHPTTESTRQPDQSASSAPKETSPSGNRPPWRVEGARPKHEMTADRPR
jgi:hypothetical protein